MLQQQERQRHNSIIIKGYFQVQRIAFAAIGIDPISMDHIITNFVLLFIILASCLCFGIGSFHFCIVNIKNVDEVTDALSPFSQIILCSSKVLFYLYKRKDIAKLLNRIWAINLEANEMKLKIIIEENKKDIVFCRSFYTSVSCTIVLALIGSPALSLYKKITYGDEFKLIPPLRATYFLDENNVINVFIIYVLTAIVAYAVLHGSVAIEGIFSWFTHNIIAQFRIVQMLVQRGATIVNDDRSSKSSSIEFIKYHRKTLELIDEMNHVFGMIVFLQTAISCLVICVLTFRFSRGGTLGDEMFRFSYLIANGLQLLMYCHCGQRIQNESEKVCTEIYEGYQWHIMSPSMRKLLLLPLMRAQKTCSLNGVFFVADLSLFLWVCRRAGSFLTLLLTIAVEGDDKDAIKPSFL